MIDDGSTDNTSEILAGYSDQFYWESQDNVGQSRTLSRGWEMSKGEVLSYLSADDMLEPGAVSAAVSALSDNPDAVATYCDFKLVDCRSRLIRNIRADDFSYEKMLSQVSCPVGPGAFFRRSAYLQSGVWDPRYRQMPDFDFWLRLGLQGRFVRLPHVLAGFRVHRGSQTYSKTTLECAAEPVQIVSNLLKRPEAIRFGSKLKRRAMASAHLVCAQLHLRAGRVKEFLDNVLIAKEYSIWIVLSPRSIRVICNAAFNRFLHRLLWTLRNVIRTDAQTK